MREDLSKFVNDTWQAAYESGRLSAGYEAALFCVINGQPIPAWLAPMVERAIKQHFLSSEGAGRGRTSPKAASRREEVSHFIVTDVDRLARMGKSKRAAFLMVAEDLDAHEGKPWTAEMVKTEYYRARNGGR